MGMSTIRRILVATDFSPDAHEAARFAVELAARLDAAVTLLHVYHLGAYVLPDGSTIIPASKMVAQHLNAIHDALLAETRMLGAASHVVVSHRTVDGVPFAEINRIAEQEQFDLVVMGTHGRTGLRQLLVGSVAEKVVRHCHRPVVTVRADEAAAHPAL
jgi:nucleotide-binding universal stress UspA family protein